MLSFISSHVTKYPRFPGFPRLKFRERRVLKFKIKIIIEKYVEHVVYALDLLGYLKNLLPHDLFAAWFKVWP